MGQYSQEELARVMRETREWQTKQKAAGKLHDLPADLPPIGPYIKYTRDCRHDLSDTRPAFTVARLEELRAEVGADSAETGCMRYVALIDGDQYIVWRDQ